MNDNKKNKKPKTAIALGYDPDNDFAPKIIATGRDILADKIIDVAKETKIPIHKDEKLASTLSKLQLGDMIPEELYGVVAEILIFVDNMDHMKSKMTPYH